MSDVEITFEREGLNGLVAVGTYLGDAARRFGVKFDEECTPAATPHVCAVIVSKGSDLLSPLTAAETEHFETSGRRANERLACEAKIIQPGEISIMTDKKTEETKTGEAQTDKFQEDFEALPLDAKFARLIKMEAITLGETFSYVINSPMKVLEKVGDAMAEFGMKIEKEAKKATRPAEEHAGSEQKGASDKKAKSKTKRPDPESADA